MILCENKFYKRLILIALFTTAPLTAASQTDRDSFHVNGTDSLTLITSNDVLSPYMKGIFLLEEGSGKLAVEYLEIAWKRSGHDPSIGGILADAYFRTRMLEKSKGVIDELLAHRPDDEQMLLLKSKITFIEGDKAGAAEILESMPPGAYRTFEVQRLLGKMYFELGEDEKALEAYRSALELDSSYPIIHFRYGLLLKKFGRMEEAEEAFAAAHVLSPTLSEPLLELAEICIGDGRYARAESLLEDVMDLDPGNDRAALMLTELYLASGELDKGIRLLEERKRLYGLPREMEMMLGRFYYEAKEYKEALSIFRTIFNRENRPEFARIIAEIYLKQGDIDQSHQYYQKAIKIDPGDYRNYLGLFFASSPRFAKDEKHRVELSDEQTIHLISKASALVDETDFEGCYLLGISLQAIDSLQAAEKFLKWAYNIDPDDEGVLLSLATNYEKSRRYEEARRYLDVLHAKKPDDPSINNFYGYLLAEMGTELDTAKEMVKKALEADPENGYYIDSLAWVYYKQGKYDEAIILLEKATSIVKDDPIILEHLGDAYRAVQHFRKALAAYEKSRHLPGSSEELIQKINTTRKGIE